MNGNAGRILCALLALCSPGVTLAQESVPPQPLTIEGAVTHVYKSVDGVELRLHVFNPPTHSPSARRPAIVFFFGGGRNQGTVVQFVPQAKHLAERGMVAIVADYRVLRRHKTTPFEAMADARSAVRWVRSRPNELGIAPDRIAAGGGSSGGHLALSTAVFGSAEEPGEARGINARPDALVLFNPPVDTSTIAQFGDRGKEASPLHHLGRNLPPTIVFHGKDDKTIPYADVERFCSEARKLGRRCELHGYEGAAHGFFNPRVEDGKWYRETLMEADRFLTGLGYLPKAP